MQRLLTLTLLLLVAAAGTPGALAQLGIDIHRLEIRDGKVFHDGVQLQEHALPDEFDATGVSFTFEYSGPVMPAITLNGRVYALEGDRLVALEDAAAEEGARAVAVMPAEYMTTADRRRQAEEAYLETLSERDRALYERLMHEREMEEEALRLAYAARRATEPAERLRLREQLQAHLGEIFELKQNNRREEIQQVESMLEVMNRQMAERESMRDEIIRRHVRDLLGGE